MLVGCARDAGRAAGRAATAQAPPCGRPSTATSHPSFSAAASSCHRPGEAAPMSLLTYRDARPWARAIRTQVASREMPPWPADPAFSRPLANDARLSAREIDDDRRVGRCRRARRRRRPRHSRQPSSTAGIGFKNRPPDAVIEMPGAFDVPADGIVPGLHVVGTQSVHRGQVHRSRRAASRASVAAVHHSDVTARTVPAGTALGRGAAGAAARSSISCRCIPTAGRTTRSASEASRDRRVVAGRREPRWHSRAKPFARPTTAGCCSTCQAAASSSFLRARSSASARAMCSRGGCTTPPTGKPERDRHRLGLWFADAPHTHEVITKRIGEAHIIEGREFVAERGLDEFPAHPSARRRLADHRDHPVPGRCDAVRRCGRTCTSAART